MGTTGRFKIYQHLPKYSNIHIIRTTRVLICSPVILAELGDHDALRHTPGYASEFRFVSAQTEELEQEAEVAHQALKGTQPDRAEAAYRERAKWLDMYGVDLHPVMVSKKKLLGIYYYRVANRSPKALTALALTFLND